VGVHAHATASASHGETIMTKTFHKLFYHAVWSTHLREPSITPDIQKVLYPFLENKAKRFGCNIRSIGGIEDHIHLAIEILPTESISDIIGKLKGSSSHFLNKEIRLTETFAWQEGFGVLTFAERDLPKILDYINRQQEHHKNTKLNALLEGMGEEK
jgi:REP element-mobilizing transposase RayT